MSKLARTILRLPLTAALLFYQSVILAVAQIWANKVRGILTTLGILIGVAAISAVIALITGMRDMVLADFESFGANRLSILPYWRDRDFKNGGRWKVVFKPSDFEQMLEKCPSVASFARDCGMGEAGVAAHAQDQIVETHMRGIDADWHGIERRGVTAGRPISAMDNLQVRRVALIDEVVRNQLHLDRDPVGQMIETQFWGRFLIIGLLEPSQNMAGRDSQIGETIVPFNYTSYKLANYPLWFDVTAIAKSRQLVEDAKAEIEFYMRQKRHLKPSEEDNFRVQTASREMEEVNKIASLVTTVAGGIVGISLLVAGVGIMNIMLVSVSERTREIGLRKAVGAQPSAICLQFLVEAVVLCVIGGALGLVVGQGLTIFVASYLPADSAHAQVWDPSEPDTFKTPQAGGLRIALPASAIQVAFSFSVGTGLLFGIFPAMKAASLDPIEALRHE